jgi:hypothetical protein
MSLADDVDGMSEVLSDMMPKVTAHSFALKTIAGMLKEVLGKRYDAHYELCRSIVATLSADENSDGESWEQINNDLRFIFEHSND